MIKGVLFDYGGVLTEAGRKDSALAIVADFYGTEIMRDAYEPLHLRLRKGEIAVPDFFAALGQLAGSDLVMTEADWLAANEAAFARSEPVYALAALLREHGIRTGILSNIHTFEAEEIARRGNYYGFDPVVLSCEVGAVKPEPQIYQTALDVLGFAPEEVLLIDDQEKCIPPAQKLGMFTIRAVAPEQLIADVLGLIKEQNGTAL